MPKIGPNKVSVDPKAYAARLTKAKKIVAAIDTAMKAKIRDMYPAVKKEAIVNKALDPKRDKKAAAKAPAKAPAKPATKAPAKKSTPLKGPAAVKEYQRQVSPKGVKKAEEGAKKGLDKKYPGLYKKSK